jgi:SAM-dependent methyltransferase
VLEPACGSGRLVAELARRGHRVTGFDLSDGMLAFARDRLSAAGLRATLRKARMEEFRLQGRFDLAHCLVSTFKYLLTERDARGHLRSVARALVPGGVYVLGLHLSEYGSSHRTRERWVAERDGTHVVCNIQGWPPDRRTRTERVRSRMVVTEGGEQRRIETSWTFRTYDAAQLRRLVRSVPELEHVATFDFTYDPEAERELDDDQLDCVLVLRRA